MRVYPKPTIPGTQEHSINIIIKTIRSPISASKIVFILFIVLHTILGYLIAVKFT